MRSMICLLVCVLFVDWVTHGQACTDNFHTCPGYAAKGYCKIYQSWMQTNCQKSCDFCSGNDCVDLYGSCASWSDLGYCTQYADWMKTNCPKTCNHCGCEYNGKTYAVGDVITTDNTYPLPCNKRVCTNNGVQLSNIPCTGCIYKGRKYALGAVISMDNTFPLPCYKMVCTTRGVQKQNIQCVGGPGATSTSKCHIFGDPHYITFDTASYYNYMGPCEYYVVKACNSFPGGTPTAADPKWYITAQHEYWTPTSTKTNIKYIRIYVPSAPGSPNPYDIIAVGLHGSNLNVDINGIFPFWSFPPSNTETFTGLHTFTFTRLTSGYLEIECTALKLKIHYRYRDLKIWVDTSMYSRRICGLCGFMDGNPSNERKLGPHPYNSPPAPYSNPPTWNECGDYYEVAPCPTGIGRKRRAVSSGSSVAGAKRKLDVVLSPANLPECDNMMEPDLLDAYAEDLAACNSARDCFCELLESYVADCDDRLTGLRNNTITKRSAEKCGTLTGECPNVYNNPQCSKGCNHKGKVYSVGAVITTDYSNPPHCYKLVCMDAGVSSVPIKCEGCLCTADYSPVCGTDGKTYTNACTMRCRGVQMKHTGKCGGPDYSCVDGKCP